MKIKKTILSVVLLFAIITSFGQSIDTSKFILNSGSFNYLNWKVRGNLIAPVKADTSNKIPGLIQIIGTDLYYVGTNNHWRTTGIPAAQVNSDWNATSGVSQVLNKPTIPTNNNQLTNGAGYITSANAASTYQPLITIGTTAQYFRGDFSLATFPTIPGQFNPIAGTNLTLSGTYPNITFNAAAGASDPLKLNISDTAGMLSPYLRSQIAAASYFPLIGGSITGTGGNGYVGFIPQSSTPSTPSSGFRLFATSPGAFAWITSQGYSRELRVRAQTQNNVYYLQDKSYTVADSADVTLKQNAIILTTSGTSGAASFNQTTGLLNIPSYANQIKDTTIYFRIGDGGANTPTAGATVYNNPGLVGSQLVNFYIAGNAIALTAYPNATYATYNSSAGTITLTNGIFSNDAYCAVTYQLTAGSSSPSNYTLPTASTSVLGGVKVDGSSITINGSGVISSSGGSSSSITPQTLTDAATVTWNLASGTNASLTIGGNRTLSISGAASGTYGTILITQDATGSRTLTLPAGSKVLSGGVGIISLTTAPAAIDILTFYYSGTTYYWTYGKNYN